MKPSLWCALLLMLVAFSVPGRDGPNDVGGLDFIALVKLAARGLSLVIFGRALLGALPARRGVVLACLGPFFLFVFWAFVSVLWSPLKSISLGQAIGLLVMVLLSAVIASRWRDAADTSVVLFALSVGLFSVALLVLAVDVVDHDLSGLNRSNLDIEEGSIGMVHPTSAGATSALGLLLLVGSRVLWGWTWSRWLLVPGVLVHLALLLQANSRTATVLVLAALALAFALWAPRMLAWGLLLGSIVGTAWLLCDPRLELFDRTLNDTSGYVTRGESTQLLLSLTGRTDLWDAVWASFLESPWIGHGYFVTSKNGLLDVWSGPANRTAHNLVLQVLVTTGVVGLLLFAIVWLRLLPALIPAFLRTPQGQRLGAFLGLIALWYLGWVQLCESFLGPIQPEAVVFYALLGLGLAQVPEGGP